MNDDIEPQSQVNAVLPLRKGKRLGREVGSANRGGADTAYRGTWDEQRISPWLIDYNHRLYYHMFYNLNVVRKPRAFAAGEPPYSLRGSTASASML
jgi:hypothetical protein